jgi:hypothetical protein
MQPPESRFDVSSLGVHPSDKAIASPRLAPVRRKTAVVAHWLLFFWLCFGLGYPTLNRFDPRALDSDAIEYFKLVVGKPSDAGDLLRYRVLVPWVAKPIFWVSQGHIRSWNPIAFGLLISNCLFTASGACLLMLIGSQYLGRANAFAGTLLYLLNFTLPARQLGLGLVESGESCFMLVLFYLLFRRKFFLLPILGVLGALAKESFVPMCAVSTAAWAISESRRGRWKKNQTIWSIAMVLIGLSTIILLQASVTGRLIWPWEFAGTLRESDVSLWNGLLGCVTDRYFWYVFGYLLPLGVLGVRGLPKAWICASIAGAAAALAMGAWNSAGGNTVPSVFNSVGPLLSLSAANFLIVKAGPVQSCNGRSGE